MHRRATQHPLLTAASLIMGVGVTFEFVRGFTNVGGHALDSFTEAWVYTAVEWIAVAVCAARVIRRREDRAAWALMTAGLACWSAGDLVWTLWLDNVASPPFPSIADAAYLLMYPCIYVALMLLIRSRLRNAGPAQWLDGGVVGLTIAAIAAALVFSTILSGTHARFVAELVNLAYPVGDFALLAFIALAYSLSNWRPGKTWLMVGGGVSLTAIADIIYVHEVAGGQYLNGTILDGMYLLAIAFLGLAAWVPDQPRAAEPAEAPHTIILTATAATGALALLVTAAFTRLTPLAVGLAAGALLLACVRAGMTYLQNVRIMRASAREALTDALSGLGNRRRLMSDLDETCRRARAGSPSTLAFFDLNGFKRYNDTFGHAAGDALLARIGLSLRDGVGEDGAVYRLGGDEFCALLSGRFGPEHSRITELAATMVERGSGFTVDTSYGLAVIPDDAPSASAALQLADERMYASKSRSSRAQARDVLMQLLNERTPDLLEHVGGVTELTRAVAHDLGLDVEQLDEVLRAAELHDVGKLAIPDEILNKPGPLDPDEWDFMRQHSIIGERILNAAPALLPVARLVRASHERWDGDGYPDGLAGIEIPLGARIVAVCDAYEAITSDRCYHRARSHAEAVAELKRCSGTQFDPDVVESLCRLLEHKPMPGSVIGKQWGRVREGAPTA